VNCYEFCLVEDEVEVAVKFTDRLYLTAEQEKVNSNSTRH